MGIDEADQRDSNHTKKFIGKDLIIYAQNSRTSIGLELVRYAVWIVYLLFFFFERIYILDDDSNQNPAPRQNRRMIY